MIRRNRRGARIEDCERQLPLPDYRIPRITAGIEICVGSVGVDDERKRAEHRKCRSKQPRRLGRTCVVQLFLCDVGDFGGLGGAVFVAPDEVDGAEGGVGCVEGEEEDRWEEKRGHCGVGEVVGGFAGGGRVVGRCCWW